LDIFATAAVRETAEKSLGLETVLNSFCGTNWHEPSANFAPLDQSKKAPSKLHYRAIGLEGKPPRFALKTRMGGFEGQSIAYQFMDPRTKGRLLVAPDVATVNQKLLDCLDSSDVVLFDGTFWSADELQEVRQDAPKAADMGHMTIRNGSLKLLAGLRARAKVYIHINNTNPILAVDSPQRAAVEQAGITVGQDGLEFEL
jgi:pyrroloquinoline quinone biosynthesis protein B